MKSCQKCGEEWTRRESPGFKACCPKCEAYLHSCRNCKLYNPSADRCSSITAECTGDRDLLNYCEEFQFRDTPNNANHRASNGSAGMAGRGLAERIERSNGNGGPRRPSRGKNKFDQLFGS